MATTPRDLTDVSSGPGRAEATYAVLDVALDAARSMPADAFAEWRVRTLRRARSRVEIECDGDRIDAITGEHVDTALVVCSALGPTPHERTEYEAEHGEPHPNLAFGDVGTALRPFIGDAIPEPRA